jgi:hypothetical protein
VTEVSESTRANTCPNGHPVPAASIFCPFCGQPMAAATAVPDLEVGEVNVAHPKFSAQFPTGGLSR